MAKYKVKQGDNLLTIAKQFNLHPDQILQANPGGSPFSLGQTIKVPPPPRPQPSGPPAPNWGAIGSFLGNQLQTFQYRTGVGLAEANYRTNVALGTIGPGLNTANATNWGLPRATNAPPTRNVQQSPGARTSAEYPGNGTPMNPSQRLMGAEYPASAFTLASMQGPQDAQGRGGLDIGYSALAVAYAIRQGFMPNYVSPSAMAALKNMGLDVSSYYSPTGQRQQGQQGGGGTGEWNAPHSYTNNGVTYNISYNDRGQRVVQGSNGSTLIGSNFGSNGQHWAFKNGVTYSTVRGGGGGGGDHETNSDRNWSPSNQAPAVNPLERRNNQAVVKTRAPTQRKLPSFGLISFSVGAG